MDKMRSHGIAILFLVSAGIFPAQGALTITTTSVPGATVSGAYAAQLQVSGANGEGVQWSVYVPPAGPGPDQGPLPPGLGLSTSGLISGTPTTANTYPFQVVAQDQMGSSTPQQLSITVSPCVPTLTPTPASLPLADVNVKYPTTVFSETICPSSGPYTLGVQPNPPAPGLLFSNGTLSGTPTLVGPNSFSITPSMGNQVLNPVAYTITVNPTPTITTTSPLPSGFVGVPYAQQITATGGVPPYKFGMNNPPPGIAISNSGLVSGTPTVAATFGAPPNPITIGVQDSLDAYSESQFEVTFNTATPLVQVSPLSLTFNAVLDSNPPLSQSISVAPVAGTAPQNFSVVLDSGPGNASAPAWLSVIPTSGAAPAALTVNVNQGNLAVASYPGRIRVFDDENFPTDVAVTLNVTSPPTKLTAAPSILRFGARATAPGMLVEDLLVSNTGAGQLPFTASVLGGSSWISGITPSSGQAALNAPVFLQVQVNTSGLPVGSYHDIIQLASSPGNVDIPITLFVAAGGPLLGVNTTGVLFQARQNGGSSAVSNIEILNIGDPDSAVNWTASLVSGSNWLNLVSSSGSATPAAPGTLSLELAQNATQLTPGPYYALVKIADPNSLNSPQFVIAVLNLEPDSTAPSPEVSPGGLFFAATATASEPSGQQVLVNTSSASPVPFQVTTTTNQGSWLSAAPSSETASGQNPASLLITVNPAGLATGIYTGYVYVSLSQVLQSVNVTFVVAPTLPANARSHAKPESTGPKPESTGPRPEVLGCTPSKLAITETGLPNNFAVPAGWPATLIVQLDDDCGSPVLNGDVIASFSNGDAALALVGDSLGNYSVTWQPGAVTSEMVITLNAAAGALQPATATLYGGISQNPTPPPTLAPGGTLNDFNPVGGAALSPGMIAQVYGSGLAAAPVSPGILPLPSMFDNTFAQVGDHQAPFYFLSNYQLNVQIPAELTASQQLPMLLSVNNALTLPITLDIVPTAPGVLSAFDGPTPPSTQNGAHIVAQHLNGSRVTTANPANPGEYLVMYLAGLGATNPPVPSGDPAPAAPSTLAAVTLAPTVTVDTLPSNVVFAGLAPHFVGLYQIDFQVPLGAHSGEVLVTVTQNGIAANPTLLPVSP